MIAKSDSISWSNRRNRIQRAAKLDGSMLDRNGDSARFAVFCDTDSVSLELNRSCLAASYPGRFVLCDVVCSGETHRGESGRRPKKGGRIVRKTNSASALIRPWRAWLSLKSVTFFSLSTEPRSLSLARTGVEKVVL